MSTAAHDATEVAQPAVAASNLEAGHGARRSMWATIFRWRHFLLPVAATAIVAAGQLAEDMSDSAPLQMLPPTLLIPRWTVIALVLYVFVVASVLEVTVKRSINALRRVVGMDEARFQAQADRMAAPTARADATILFMSAVIAVLIFVGLGSDLLMDDPVTHLSRHLPDSPILAGVILAAYAVIGWAIWRIVYMVARMAWVLGRLSREPLNINVFDTSDLLPFGNIALGVALVPVGVVVILLIGLGAPNTVVGWGVLLEATGASLLALVVPLIGVHRQMAHAKYTALADLGSRIHELYADVLQKLPTEVTEATMLGNTTNSLVQLRKTVQEMPTWPFRNTVAFGRALLIASAPLIYATLSELIRVLWIDRLASPGP